MRRFAVMGFTEAELGFIVAALFAAVAVTSLRERDAHATDLAGRPTAEALDSLLPNSDGIGIASRCRSPCYAIA